MSDDINISLQQTVARYAVKTGLDDIAELRPDSQRTAECDSFNPASWATLKLLLRFERWRLRLRLVSSTSMTMVS
jgi:hypothetical protein